MTKNRIWLGAALIALSFSHEAQAQLPAGITKRQNVSIDALKAEAPGVQFLMSSDRVSRIYGAPFAVGLTPQLAAEDFVAQYSHVFSGGSAELVPSGEQDVMSGKFTAFYFEQQVRGIPVHGSNVTILVRNDPGFPVVLAVNGAKVVRDVETLPTIRSVDSVRLVRRATRGYVSFTQPELTIFQDELTTHLAWTYIASNDSVSTPVMDRVFVDAHSGELLDRQSQIWHVDMTGTVSGFATPGLLPDQGNNSATLTNIFGAKVAISGGATAYTDAAGAFTIANAGSSPVTVNSTLEGRWARVINNSGTTLSFGGAFTPPGPANFVYNPTPSVQTTSQVNGLIQTTTVHDFVKSISSSYPGVDIQMPVNVNVAGSGNAFYDGSSINFYNAGGVYPNTCYTTVVWHEYGHHIVQSAGTQQNGYGEGMGDVTGCLLGDTNNLGMDFRGQGTGPLRNAYNTITYPSSAEIHTQGMILSGAFWLTLDQLKLTLSTPAAHAVLRPLWLNSILLRPTTISPAITVDILTLDDNDSVLGNGTPHYDQVKAGFNPKGLTAPNLNPVAITPQGAPQGLIPSKEVRDGYAKTMPIVAQVTNGAGVVDPANVRLQYAIGAGSYATAVMAPIGNNLFRGLIPRPGIGQGVRYYFEATSTAGTTQRFPDTAPVSNLEFVFGKGTQSIFTDTCETALGWTVANDASLTTGAWVRANPNGSSLPPAANPEDDSNDAGTQCYFTGQAAAGATVGTNDVDGGPTRLTSPAFSLLGGNGFLEYSRWFFNDDGDDSMTVELSNDNGATWVTVDSTQVTSTSNTWIRKSIIVGNYLNCTATMRMRVTTSDNPNDSITEAAIDNIIISRIVTK